MVIDNDNKNYIEKEFYFHDAIFHGFYYRYNSRSVIVKSEIYHLKLSYQLTFKDVVYFEMISCENWGRNSPRVADWEIDSKNLKLQNIKNEVIKDPELNASSRLLDDTLYFGSYLTLVNGDKFYIICEKIEIKELPFIQ